MSEGTYHDSEVVPNLVFVNATYSPGQDHRKARSLIRAHVSRQYWAKAKIQSSTKSTRQRKAPPNADAERAVVRFALGQRSKRGGDDDEETSHSSKPAHRKAEKPVTTPMNSSRNRISISLRDVAADCIDPFESSPCAFSSREASPLLNDATTMFRNYFMPDAGEANDAIARGWFSAYLNDRTVFNAFSYSQLFTIYAKIRTDPSFTVKGMLTCYSEAVRGINHSFDAVVTRFSDQTLLAILVMANSGDPVPTYHSARTITQGPLNDMQALEATTRLQSVAAHSIALGQILTARGGLSEITFPGLASMISYGDMAQASLSLRKPALPFTPIGRNPTLSLNMVDRTDHPLSTLATGFEILFQVLPSKDASELQGVAFNLSQYSIAVYDYVMGRPQAHKLGLLAQERNYVQHSLMSLYPGDGGEEKDRKDPFYQACWLACQVYSLIAVLPIPNKRAPFSILSLRIQEQISARAVGSGWHKARYLMLWIAVMGALAAGDEARRVWYLSVLERLSTRLQISSWDKIKIELEKFLWFDNTSSSDGQRLWSEIQKSSPFS